MYRYFDQDRYRPKEREDKELLSRVGPGLFPTDQKPHRRGSLPLDRNESGDTDDRHIHPKRDSIEFLLRIPSVTGDRSFLGVLQFRFTGGPSTKVDL